MVNRDAARDNRARVGSVAMAIEGQAIRLCWHNSDPAIFPWGFDARFQLGDFSNFVFPRYWTDRPLG